MGLNGKPLTAAQPASIPAMKLMPEYFKELGYTTHLVGKWGVGYERWNSTPTYRGFDSFFGFYNEFTSYYDYLSTWTLKNTSYTGFDLRKGTEPAWEFAGQYATDVFTDYSVKLIQNHDPNLPLFMILSHLAVHSANEGKLLEAPQEAINKFKHVYDSNRRTYAAMVSKLDDSVGLIVDALEKKGMLQNSVIVFVSDNGAPTIGRFRNWGSNYPLRGIKSTLFEGGVRAVGFLWSPLLVQSQRVSSELIHVTDWMPTLYSAAGGDISLLDPNMDGLDQWSSLVYDLSSPRTDMLININDQERAAALRFHNWKLVLGAPIHPGFDDHIGDSGKGILYEVKYNTSNVYNSPAGISIAKVSYTITAAEEYRLLRGQAIVRCANHRGKANPCDLESGEVCLYDILRDPCEENNLAKYFPNVVRSMKRALVEYKSGAVPLVSKEPDIERADPKLFQYTWNPWLDCADATCKV
ncbi:arylsulfatase B-like isoform X2 [Photinus pyralis]|nr:arylsulfatase B-like isoform X2 [Photinus pyralis]XP_031341213.1 arylsulfatase B-like isoform X2 [Photinus pyralis]